MNVVDSSGWLEYFADGPNADFFAVAIENVEELIVPVITLYEVFKRVHQQRSEGDALQAVAMWVVSEPAALWHVPLAHYGPDSLSGRFAGDDSGVGLAQRTESPLSANAG